MGTPDPHRDDAGKALRFMLGKAAIFVLVPLLAAAVAVWWRFG